MNGIRPFRKYRCTVQWVEENDLTNTIKSTERIINLADVIDYEEFVSPRFKDGKSRTLVHIGINKPSIVISESFRSFEKIHDQFLAEMGMLDDRSLKKNYGYNGPVKWLFSADSFRYAGFMFPRDHDFDKLSSQRNMDFVIAKYSSTWN